MENLSLNEPPHPGPPLGPGGHQAPPIGPPPVPQLPPQMFTTAAQLLDLTDSKYRRRSVIWAPRRNGKLTLGLFDLNREADGCAS